MGINIIYHKMGSIIIYLIMFIIKARNEFSFLGIDVELNLVIVLSFKKKKI